MYVTIVYHIDTLDLNKSILFHSGFPMYTIQDGYIVNVENGEIVDVVIDEIVYLQLDYYNNNSH
jgi:hypothetical protein